MDNFTELQNRKLWFDGDSTITNQSIMPLLLSGKCPDKIYTDELTEDIIRYNKFAAKDKKILVKTEVKPFNYEWNIPEEYKKINVLAYVFKKFQDMSNEYTEEECEIRIKRIKQEFELYEQFNLMDTLRSIIYIINSLLDHNIPWGVGRGSSVSSYVLYVIGVHDVDSIEYDLDINDFLHKELDHGNKS